MREAGDRCNQGMVLHLLGGTARELGNLDDARRYWTEALEIFEELDDPRADELRGRLSATG
jgi:hypothetical protein